MANVKISALPVASTPLAGTEVLPIVQSGVTAKVSVANLTAGRDISANTLSLNTALDIAYGGTGQTTANAAFNALAPSQTSNSGKYLTTDGSNTSWATNPLGTVTSVSGTAPVSVATGTTTPVISMAAANTTTNGYLTSTDWNTFNNKQSAGSYLTSVTADAPLTGLGTSASHLSMPVATTSVNGYLSSTDWTTFNGKQAALVSGTNIKTVNGTTLLGSGDLGIITGTYGGTGINNGSNTITIAGNLTHAGAFTQSYTATANTAVTLPAGATAASNNLLSSATAVAIVTGTPSSSTYLRGDGTWATIASGGTVTSVAATVPTFLSVSGSPITTNGTLAISYSGTALPILNGGTGQTTAAAAYNALSPMTTTGDITYEASASTAARLAIGTAGQVLTVVSGLPAWSTSASTIATNLAGGTTGAVPYQSGVATTSFLSGNTSTTPNFYTSTGTGTVAQAPTLTASTGSGSVVLATSPTLITPALGTPSAIVLTNATSVPVNQATGALPVANGGTGATATTGSGNSVLATSPTLVTPILGTPTSGTLTNCTFPTLNQNTTGSAGSVANALTAGTGLTATATYNGSAAITFNATGTTINSQTSAYVLVAGDAGKTVSITTGGVTVNNSVMSAGNIVSIYNNSGSSQTITQGTGVTMQWAGQASSSTGNRTLGLYGIATLIYISASNVVITGSGLA